MYPATPMGSIPYLSGVGYIYHARLIVQHLAPYNVANLTAVL